MGVTEIRQRKNRRNNATAIDSRKIANKYIHLKQKKREQKFSLFYIRLLRLQNPIRAAAQNFAELPHVFDPLLGGNAAKAHGFGGMRIRAGGQDQIGVRRGKGLGAFVVFIVIILVIDLNAVYDREGQGLRVWLAARDSVRVRLDHENAERVHHPIPGLGTAFGKLGMRVEHLGGKAVAKDLIVALNALLDAEKNIQPVFFALGLAGEIILLVGGNELLPRQLAADAGIAMQKMIGHHTTGIARIRKCLGKLCG